MAAMPDFRCSVNTEGKSTELPLLRIGGSVQRNPHMRAFWAGTISFFLAFFGWFALAPLGVEVATSMGICENQLFPPAEHPKRAAYLKYKNLKSGHMYCRYGLNSISSPTDCAEVPAGDSSTGGKYDTSVLVSCMCTAGTRCKSVLDLGGVAAVTSTILMRVLLGTMLERYGPTNVQAGILIFGAAWIYASAGITAPWNYTLIRFFIGACGATFVTTQFWCSLMFAPNIVGTANATCAGWGNLGGGVVQFFMILAIFEPLKAAGLSQDAAWRLSMCVPATVFLLCAACIKLLCWDTPFAKRCTPADLGKKKAASVQDYIKVLKDPRVLVMIFQYGACFGTELSMNNQLKTHFQVYFQMKSSDASLVAAAHGCTNLFARSLGGILSDILFVKFGFSGRLWAQFLCLFFEAIFLFGFGMVDNQQPWYTALIILLIFSLFVEMAAGTSYGIVPFMVKEQLAIVSALVGAGGNLGAVIAGLCFYGPIANELLPFKLHAAFVMFWALLSPVYYWPELGGMFSGPQSAPCADKARPDEGVKGAEVMDSETASSVDAEAGVADVRNVCN